MLSNCQGLFVRNGREKRNGENERFQAYKVILLPEDLRKMLKVQLPLKTKWKMQKPGAVNTIKWEQTCTKNISERGLMSLYSKIHTNR